MQTRNYGLHLTIDGYNADPIKLNDLDLLFSTLHDLPEKIGMSKIGFPQLARFKERDIAGISGVQMIVESHISIHTYPLKRFFSMDVYSCKNFDYKKVLKYIQRAYDIEELEINVIERGKKFPQENSVDSKIEQQVLSQ